MNLAEARPRFADADVALLRPVSAGLAHALLDGGGQVVDLPVGRQSGARGHDDPVVDAFEVDGTARRCTAAAVVQADRQGEPVLVAERLVGLVGEHDHER